MKEPSYEDGFFLDISTAIELNPAQLLYGIAITDINDDGQFEAVVANFQGPNRVLAWQGDKLVDVAVDMLADADRQAIGLAAGDIDGDGFEELYILNTDSFAGRKRLGDRLIDKQGEGYVDLFTTTAGAQVQNLVAGRSVAAVDRLGNGHYGFAVASYGGPLRFYELGNGQLHDCAPEIGLDHTAGGRGLIALPLVSEHMDIFAANEMGPNFLFRNNGQGRFEDVAGLYRIDDPYRHGRGVAALDADGDGLFDLVVGNWEDGHRLWLQREGWFEDAAPAALAMPSRVRTVIVADFDNDGFEEIFFNNIGEPNRLFRKTRRGWQQVDIGDALEPYGFGTGAAVADFDNDGVLELLIAHGETAAQPLTLYQADAEGNHWLRVLPLTRYGAPARGAVVELTAGGRRQRRVIDAGSGYLCQMEPVAHFGLGKRAEVEQLRIIWPDGRRLTLDAPAVDRLHRVAWPA